MCIFCKVLSLTEDLKITAHYSFNEIEFEGDFSKESLIKAMNGCTEFKVSVSTDKDGKIHLFLKPIKNENV